MTQAEQWRGVLTIREAAISPCISERSGGQGEKEKVGEGEESGRDRVGRRKKGEREYKIISQNPQSLQLSPDPGNAGEFPSLRSGLLSLRHE